MVQKMIKRNGRILKKTEEWRYKKLTSTDADNFREREKEHVSHYVSDKRQDLVDAAGGHSSVYKHIKEKELTPKSKANEKGRKGKYICKL